MLIGAAAAWREASTFPARSSVQLPQHTGSVGALNYFLALVKLGFVPTAGVSTL